MAKLNLEKMSIVELRELAAAVEQELGRRKKDEVKGTVAQIKSLAATLGMSVEDILRYGKKAKTSKGEAKYRNPENPAQTWTGKGRQPAWVKTQMNRGKTLEELLLAS
jgi:DNA-binding protein H-NS